MESSLIPRVVNPNCIKILQLTDMHLFCESSQQLLGVNTWQSYQAVIQALQAQANNFDLVIATGDVAQDQTIAAYQYFAQGIASLGVPCVWLPGNHDDRSSMEQILINHQVSAHKRIVLGEDWQICLLDSQVVGKTHGWLSQQELSWLEHQLATSETRHSLVALHHHPVASGCAWLDQHQLLNAAQLAEILVRYPRAGYLVCGHIHQSMDRQWLGKRLFATPSTCVQFRPNSQNFSLDSLTPGWRWLELYPDGSLITQVEHLETESFLPDHAAKGY